MKLHFVYNNRDFYYDPQTGLIDRDDRHIPVYRDLQEVLLSSLDDDTKVSLLRTVLHAYNRGYMNGQDDKLKDIRRVLGVNFN